MLTYMTTMLRVWSLEVAGRRAEGRAMLDWGRGGGCWTEGGGTLGDWSLITGRGGLQNGRGGT